jgi:hypothetical protein
MPLSVAQSRPLSPSLSPVGINSSATEKKYETEKKTKTNTKTKKNF